MTVTGAPQASAARNALMRGDMQATRQLAATMVAKDPQDAEGHFLLGVAESDAGRIQAGIRHLDHAVTIDPRGEYRAQLARLLIMTRRDGDAAATLREAEQAPPADAFSRDRKSTRLTSSH